MQSNPNVDQAGIYSLDGRSWATSSSMQLTSNEVKGIVFGINNKSIALQNGFMAQGVKYMYLHTSYSNALIGKKGPYGIMCATSLTAVVCITTKSGVNLENIAVHTDMATILKSKGY